MNSPTPRPRFLSERLDDGEVWVDLETGRIYGLNETGRAILDAWRDGGRTPEAIASRLAESFDVEARSIVQEVQAFLEEAERRGLLDP